MLTIQFNIIMIPFSKLQHPKKILLLLFSVLGSFFSAQTQCAINNPYLTGYFGDTNSPPGSAGPHLLPDSTGGWVVGTGITFGSLAKGASSALGIGAVNSGASIIRISNITTSAAPVTGNNYVYAPVTLSATSPGINFSAFSVGKVGSQNFSFSLVIFDVSSGVSTTLINNTAVTASYASPALSYNMLPGRSYQIRFYPALSAASAGSPATLSIDNPILSGYPVPALSATSLYICPSGGSANLSSLVTSNTPGNVYNQIRWFNSSNTQVANPASVPAGTYRAYYYNATNSCYSTASPTVTVTNTCPADLAVTKTDGATAYMPGTTTTYTITVTNKGPNAVTNATVSDPLPAGIPAANVSYTAVASSGSATNVSGTQTGAINDLVSLPSGGTVTYTAVVNIPSSFTGNLVNTATVTPPSNITDTDAGNNTATDTNTPATSDLRVTKTIDKTVTYPGDNVNFIISAFNLGLNNNTNVSVTDLLPSGYTLISATASQGTSYNASTGIWNIGNLNNGEAASLGLSAKVNASGNYTNVAVISTTSGIADPVSANDTDSVTPTIGAAPDIDNDGISESADLDNDNDGILDTAENVCTVKTVEGSPVYRNDFGTGALYSTEPHVLGHSYNPTTAYDGRYVVTTSNSQSASGAQTNLTGNLDAGYDDIANGSTNGRYLMININSGVTTASPMYRVNDLPTVPGLQYRFRIDMAGLAEGTASVPDLQLTIRDAGNNVLFTANSASLGTANDDVWRRLNLDFTATTSKVTLEIYNRQTNGSGNDVGIDNIVLAPLYCDEDNDGIANYLDLDSDNDGCLDAIEGDENVTSNMLVNAASGLSVGAGSSASNQNLCASASCVDANGIPNLVNSGGAADIGGNIGQGIGTSQNSAMQDAQCANAFGCTSAMYLSQGANLYTISTSTNPFTYPLSGTAAVTYNAIGLNPINGLLYGMQVPNSTNVLVINPDGTSINVGPVTGLPAGVTFNAGEIDNLGNYYVKVNNNNNQLYKVNLSTMTATVITLSANVNLLDIAFRTTNGLLYGVNSTNGQLVSINPATGAVTAIGIAPGGINFGAMFASSTGELYGVVNAGGFYQFNLENGQRVMISNALASSANDGAHCVTAPIAFSADLGITKTDGVTTYTSGTNTIYTITATNAGPFGVLNASVTDAVPMGIPAANVSYSAVAAGGAVTSVSGTQTGAINDLVGLPVGGSVTYTVVVSIPLGYNGNLVNTAVITPPSNITEINITNNTVTDTNNQDVCYRPAVTSGTVLGTPYGITSLGRAGAAGANWPRVRKGAWMALESKTKGFVMNRLTTAQIAAIPAADLVEGMMVYNVTLDCLQINTTGTPSGWACFNIQACPSN